MEGISNIKIIGMDDKRPPRIGKEPYIDLFFQLSHKAPLEWCIGFNELLVKHEYTPKIKTNEGLFIEAWVRRPDEIAGLFQIIKAKVTECTTQYIENIAVSQRDAVNNSTLAQKEGDSEQGRLNKVIAELDFNS